jgi:hypothetical protein
MLQQLNLLKLICTCAFTKHKLKYKSKLLLTITKHKLYNLIFIKYNLMKSISDKLRLVEHSSRQKMWWFVKLLGLSYEFF